jgi:hypothetical protein
MEGMGHRVWNRLEPCKVDNACYLKEGEGRGGKGRGERKVSKEEKEGKGEREGIRLEP